MGSASSTVSYLYTQLSSPQIIIHPSGVPIKDTETQMMFILCHWIKLCGLCCDSSPSDLHNQMTKPTKQTYIITTIFPLDLIWLIIDQFTYQPIFNELHSDKLTFPDKYGLKSIKKTPKKNIAPYSLSTVSTSSGSHHKTFKIILTGDRSVGKFSYIQQFVNKHFPLTQDERQLIDPSFSSVFLQNIEGFDIDLNFLYGDTSYWTGYHRYSPYDDCDAIIMMYDITNKRSYDSIQTIYDHINKYPAINSKKPLKIVIANKMDLYHVYHEVEYKEALKFCKLRLKVDLFMTVSSKTEYHLWESLRRIAVELIKPYKRRIMPFYG